MNSAEPGSAEALAELFSGSVLPDGWSKLSREYDENFVLNPSTGGKNSEPELKYNAVSDHQGILYYQTGWSDDGKLPAMLIEGMPSWNNDEDGFLKGNNLSNDMHGAGGKDLIIGKRGHDFLYGNSGADTLKGGNGHDGWSGGAGAEGLEGGRGQNPFGDERDGKRDVIKVKQDKSPDRINNLDKKDMIQIQASASNADDAAVKVTTEDLEGVGRSLMI